MNNDFNFSIHVIDQLALYLYICFSVLVPLLSVKNMQNDVTLYKNKLLFLLFNTHFWTLHIYSVVVCWGHPPGYAGVTTWYLQRYAGVTRAKFQVLISQPIDTKPVWNQHWTQFYAWSLNGLICVLLNFNEWKIWSIKISVILGSASPGDPKKIWGHPFRQCEYGAV